MRRFKIEKLHESYESFGIFEKKWFRWEEINHPNSNIPLEFQSLNYALDYFPRLGIWGKIRIEISL